MDAVRNFAFGTFQGSPGIGAADLTVSLSSGHGARFPAAPFNAIICEQATDPASEYYSNRAEIVRVTNIVGDSLTITRAQEGSSACAFNTSGKTYLIAASVTAKIVTDLSAAIVSDFDQSLTAAEKRTARRNIGFSDTATCAELDALGAVESSKLRMAFCSDMLSANGVGDLVFWDGSAWRSTTSGLLATTDFLTQARDYRMAGLIEIRGTRTLAGLLVQSGAAAGLFNATGASGTGAGFGASGQNQFGLPKQITLCDSGTTATGYARLSNVPVRVRGGSDNSQLYISGSVYVTALSNSTDEYSFRIGFQSAIGAPLATSEYGIFYDRGNVLGSLNPSNLDTWLAVVRENSVNVALTNSAVAPSTGQAGRTLLEVVIDGATVSLYVGGVLIDSRTTANIGQSFNPMICVRKSAGTANRGARICRPTLFIRDTVASTA